MSEEKKLPTFDKTAGVKVTFEFPTSDVIVKNVSLGRARVTATALCKKFGWEQTEK